MTKDEALKLALEALETELAVDWTNNDEFNLSAEKMHEAITAIKKALAQPDEQLLISNILSHYGLQAIDFVADFKEAMKQVEQEPVAWLLDGINVVEFERQSYHDGPEWTPLYTAPPQRTWVGLTDDEMYEAVRTICKADSVARSLFDISKDEYRAIEAKLKEKNT